MAKVELKSGSVVLSDGLLQLQNGVAMDNTLRSVADQSNTISPLKLSTGLVSVSSTLQIATNDTEYLDAEDIAGNNRFTISRNAGSQVVNVDFASNPTLATDQVGAIRTYQDGVSLSDSISFLKNGNVGVGTSAPVSKLETRTTDGFGAVRIYNNNDSSAPFHALRGNGGGVGLNTFSSNGTIDSPTDRTALGYLTRFTGQVRVDGAFRTAARIEYYLTSAPSAANLNCGIRFMTASPTTYSIEERVGITSDGNLQIGDSIVNNRNSKVFIKGSGSTTQTTSLLVRNSSNTQIFKVEDGGIVQIGRTDFINWTFSSNTLTSNSYAFIASNNGTIISTGALSGGVHGNNNGGKVSDSGIGVAQVASAVLEVSSTTRGFLPPRMTTAEKLAIATPDAGLMVYDNNLNQMSYFNGATWINF